MKIEPQLIYNYYKNTDKLSDNVNKYIFNFF